MKDKPLSPTVNKGRILRMRELTEKLSLSDGHIYALIHKNLFPRPFRLIDGGRAMGWLESEVDSWLDQRLRDEK